jgi:hypothetical protein
MVNNTLTRLVINRVFARNKSLGCVLDSQKPLCYKLHQMGCHYGPEWGMSPAIR